MRPVLFYVGPYPVFSYGVFVLAGMINQPVHERKKNQRQGFFACLGANTILLIVLYAFSTTGSPMEAADIGIFFSALPWIVNIGILALALRPQFAVGYLAFFAVIIVSGMVLGIVFVAACFASIVTMVVLGAGHFHRPHRCLAGGLFGWALLAGENVSPPNQAMVVGRSN